MLCKIIINTDLIYGLIGLTIPIKLSMTLFMILNLNMI